MFAFFGPITGAKLGAVGAFVTMAVVIPLVTIDLLGEDPASPVTSGSISEPREFMVDPNLSASASVSISAREITTETTMAAIIPVPGQVIRDPGSELHLLAFVVDQLGIRIEASAIFRCLNLPNIL